MIEQIEQNIEASLKVIAQTYPPGFKRSLIETMFPHLHRTLCNGLPETINQGNINNLVTDVIKAHAALVNHSFAVIFSGAPVKVRDRLLVEAVHHLSREIMALYLAEVNQPSGTEQ